MAILSCHVSIKLPPKISDGQEVVVVETAFRPCRKEKEVGAHRRHAEQDYDAACAVDEVPLGFMGSDFVLFRLGTGEVIQGIESQRQEECAAADGVQVAEHGPLVEGVAVGVEWAEGYPQGGETPEVPGPAFDPVVTPVAEQEDPDRTHRADEYVSQWGVVVTAHIVLNLDAEHQPPHRAQHDRQQQTDNAYGASYPQVGNDQGVSALRQLLDRWLHWFGPTDWSPYHSL